MTVRELKNLCNAQIRAGNGEKKIVMPVDDEGNGYRTLDSAFCDIKYLLYDEKGNKYDDWITGYVRDAIPKNDNIEDYILLG